MQIASGRLNTSELEYLENSYHEIEALWLSETKNVKPSLIIIGEAPLFGSKKSYIYSRESPQTSFLFHSAIEDIDTKNSSKESLLNALAKFRILILDLMPYALNEESTPKFNFNNIDNKSRTALAQHSYELHFTPKIKLLKKENSNIKIVARYNRIRDTINTLSNTPIDSISMRGGMINTREFRRILASHGES